MSIAIRYYTKGGNTEKLAKAIEEVLGTEAKKSSLFDLFAIVRLYS